MKSYDVNIYDKNGVHVEIVIDIINKKFTWTNFTIPSFFNREHNEILYSLYLLKISNEI